jgi:hypothetical protein
MSGRRDLATRRMPDLTARLSSNFDRHGGMNNLTKILGIVFAPILMQNPRPATIQWRAEDNGRPNPSARLDQNTKMTGLG